MKQLTVLVDNHPGVLVDISEALGSRGINIETLDGEAAASTGVVSMTVDRYDDALVALRDAGFQAISEEALVLKLPDRAGALAQHFGRFKELGLNIRSMRIVKREAGATWVTLVTDDNDQAGELVRDVLVGPTMPPAVGPPEGEVPSSSRR